jgi:hypothetical protein
MIFGMIVFHMKCVLIFSTAATIPERIRQDIIIHKLRAVSFYAILTELKFSRKTLMQTPNIKNFANVCLAGAGLFHEDR